MSSGWHGEIGQCDCIALQGNNRLGRLVAPQHVWLQQKGVYAQTCAIVSLQGVDRPSPSNRGAVSTCLKTYTLTAGDLCYVDLSMSIQCRWAFHVLHTGLKPKQTLLLHLTVPIETTEKFTLQLSSCGNEILLRCKVAHVYFNIRASLHIKDPQYRLHLCGYQADLSRGLGTHTQHWIFQMHTLYSKTNRRKAMAQSDRWNIDNKPTVFLQGLYKTMISRGWKVPTVHLG